MARRSSKNPPAGVTVGRRGARGGKVEVTELGPKWLPLLPMCSFSIMETILTLNTSMNSLEECFCRCEQHLHHHTRLRRLCADMVWSARKVAILCLNDFPQGISIFTITREIRYLNFLSFVRQEGDWAFVVSATLACRLCAGSAQTWFG